MYYYIYVLRSLKDNKFYTGYSSDLRKRIQQHQNGLVQSTKSRLPIELIYFEGCKNQQDATRREKYLKTTYGKRYLKNRLANYLKNIPQGELSTDHEAQILNYLKTSKLKLGLLINFGSRSLQYKRLIF